MASSGRERHRDRDAGFKFDDEAPTKKANDARVFKISEAERQDVAKSLRFIDEARRALEAQRNPDNREIIRELRASADRIFDVMNELDELTDL